MAVSKKNSCPCCNSKSTYKQYLKTPAWKAKKQESLEWANHSCQLCNSGRNLHVHHRSYENLWNEKLSDLVVLCKICREKHHILPGKDQRMEIKLPHGSLSKKDKLEVFKSIDSFPDWLKTKNMLMASMLEYWKIEYLDDGKIIRFTAQENNFAALYFTEAERATKLKNFCYDYFGYDAKIQILQKNEF